MKKAMFFILSLALVSFSFQSCGSDDDDDRPTISNLEPTEGEKLQIGKAVHFEADIASNNGLKSYKIDIHNNFDGHSHTKSISADTDSVAYSFTKTWTTDKTDGESLFGKKNTTLHHHEIVIPTTIDGKPVKTGKYHFVLYVVDQDGYETLQARNIVLTYDEVDENAHH